MPYRSDIEGLRGVAVALALLFHLNVPGTRLGFLGVDIFFVISGYLITQILLRDLEQGDYSLIEFYRRRAVRILPALLVMLVLVCIAGSLILLPTEIRPLGISAAAAAGFVSNLFFWRNVGYFNLSEIMPLLHTWSLGVEEQFYLLYPLALYAGWRWARRWLVPLLWAATLGSLAFSWLLVLDRPDAAFYLLPSRGWELGLGALAAAGGLPRIRQNWLGAALAAAGVVLILALPWVHAAMRPFVTMPAPGALPACLGAVLLLTYGAQGPSATLLSLAPLRWLGRISYSLYLWHFPLIALYQMAYGQPSGVLVPGMIAAASVIAGALSYALVETPFRRRFRHDGDPRRIVAAGVAACAAVAVAGVALAAAAPYVRPLPSQVAKVAAYADYRGEAEFQYQHGPVECYGATRRYDLARCIDPDPARRNILVLGDSYAGHLWRALAERFPGDKVMLAASGSCRPLIGGKGRRLCREMVDRVISEVIAKRRVQGVVLAGHWVRSEIDLLAPTIRAIQAHGVTVTVVGPVVQYRSGAPRVVAKALLAGDPAVAERERTPGPGRLDPQMRAMTEAAGARYFSLLDSECPAGRCRLLTRDGAPFHFDDAHYTLSGAREVIQGFPRP